METNNQSKPRDLDALTDECRRIEKDVARFAKQKLVSLVVRGEMRKSPLYRSWWRGPMNYARCIELPLTHALLDVSSDHTILDIGSPKMLSLYQAWLGCKHVIATDIAPGFAGDLQMICSALGANIETLAMDARLIAFPGASIERIYSISVIEHIPNDGDRTAISEIARVLKPGGRFVMTLPAYPQYMEEWLSSRFGWEAFSERRADGRCFYQRRYDQNTLLERFTRSDLQFEDIIYIAEVPLEPVHVRDDGMLIHNCTQVVERFRKPRYRRVLDLLPHVRYRYESQMSRQLRYLTRDAQDSQIRQVVVSMIKSQG